MDELVQTQANFMDRLTSHEVTETLQACTAAAVPLLFSILPPSSLTTSSLVESLSPTLLQSALTIQQNMLLCESYAHNVRGVRALDKQGRSNVLDLGDVDHTAL